MNDIVLGVVIGCIGGVLILLGITQLIWPRMQWKIKAWYRRWRFDPEEFAKSLEPLQKSFQEADERMKREHESDPNNGKLGYWQVSGIRHNAVVKASSAMEALKKAEGHVNDWEMPRAQFLGEQMPDVYEC
jgi:hypothetical protein